MKTCWYYLPLQPIRSPLIDSVERTPLVVIPLQGSRYSYRLALLTDDTGRPECIRIEIPGLATNEIPKDCLPMIQLAREHMLSVLRIVYDHQIYYWRGSIWNFIDDGDPPNMNMSVSEWRDSAQLNTNAVSTAFATTIPLREELRLLLDADLEHIPLQYRYLSLYRLLELHYSSNGKWRDGDLDALIQRANASITRKDIQTLRQKCAHIKTTNRKSPTGESFGVTHLNQQELVHVAAALPGLKSVCTQLINELGQGKFMLTTEPSTSKLLGQKPGAAVQEMKDSSVAQ